MKYIENQINKFNTEKTPQWKRIKLPKEIFQEGIGEFENIDIIKMEHYEPIILKHILKAEADLTAIAKYDEILDYLNIDTSIKESLGEKFSSYINANFNHGLLIHAKKNRDVNLDIFYKFDNNSPTLVDHHLIIAEEGSEIAVTLDYKSKDGSKHRHYSSIKVIAKENSKVKITLLQRLNEESLNLQQVFTDIAENADVIVNDIEIGASIKAVSVAQTIEGFRGNASTNSLYFGQKHSRTDLSYTSRHRAKNTTSSIFSKGSLDKHSKKVFRGNLYFERGTSQSVGREEEFVLLLDPELKSDSMPGLFCQEDDVIGEHAASVGQIDEEKLFYIMTRGYDEDKAKHLMIESGYQEVIQKMDIGRLGEEIIEELKERIS